MDQDGMSVMIETSKNSVDGVVSETVIVKKSRENLCFSEEKSDSRLQTNGFVIGNGHPEVNGHVSESETIILKSSKQNSDSTLQDNGFGLCKHHQEVDYGRGIDHVNGIVLDNEGSDSGENNNGVASKQLINDTDEKSGIGDAMDHVDQRSSESSCETVDGFANESTVIVIKTLEEACVDGSNVVLEAKDNGYDSCKVLTERPKTKVVEADLCLIDVKGAFKEHFDGESLCRICHLSSEHVVHGSTTAATTTTTELIQIGCGCKDELGIAHGHCAEAWFKLKGNRLCEICGQIAENVTGVGDNGFIENWYLQGSRTVGVRSADQGRGRWRGQPYCNFFMGCLVRAFLNIPT